MYEEEEELLLENESISVFSLFGKEERSGSETEYETNVEL